MCGRESRMQPGALHAHICPEVSTQTRTALAWGHRHRGYHRRCEIELKCRPHTGILLECGWFYGSAFSTVVRREVFIIRSTLRCGCGSSSAVRFKVKN